MRGGGEEGGGGVGAITVVTCSGEAATLALTFNDDARADTMANR